MRAACTGSLPSQQSTQDKVTAASFVLSREWWPGGHLLLVVFCNGTQQFLSVLSLSHDLNSARKLVLSAFETWLMAQLFQGSLPAVTHSLPHSLGGTKNRNLREWPKKSLLTFSASGIYFSNTSKTSFNSSSCSNRKFLPSGMISIDSGMEHKDDRVIVIKHHSSASLQPQFSGWTGGMAGIRSKVVARTGRKRKRKRRRENLSKGQQKVVVVVVVSASRG